MGNVCLRREPAVVVTDPKGLRESDGGRHGSDQHKLPAGPNSFMSSLADSTVATVMASPDSVELFDPPKVDSVEEETGSDDFKSCEPLGLPDSQVMSSLPPLKRIHQRNRSDQVIDYLRAEGPSGNRVMVHIETPLGVRIEEVYDGVHDGDILGEGITGKVRRITHKETGIQRAVKRLDLGLVNSDEDMNRLLEEVKIMCALDHPNIVCLEEVYEGDSELYLTQELCSGGDLFDRLEEQSNYSYTEAECARLVKQIISSVIYLHSKNIIHRDLKLENFLFCDRDGHSDLKMIDFGLSKHFKLGEVQHDQVGTPYTVAPEVILGNGYDEKCDVWAIGVIAYLLLSGDTPFGGADEGEDLREVRQNITSGHVPFDSVVWDNVSDLAISFIKSLLVLDPDQRPSAEEAQNHPWIQLMRRQSSIGEEEFLDPKVVNGLVSFKELSSARKFLSEVLSFTLQPDQIAGLREEFEKMDVSGKGEISLDGFKSALLARSSEHVLSDDEIEELFNALKVRNTDMSIRWHEFIAACLSQCHIDDRNIRLAFDRLDTDRKGYITLKDLKYAMDFYGSDCRSDLQNMWINNVMDYKCEKEHMTYDDFYKLLKLERHGVTPKPEVEVIKAVRRHKSDRTFKSNVRSFVSSSGADFSAVFATMSHDDDSLRSSRGLTRQKSDIFLSLSYDDHQANNSSRGSSRGSSRRQSLDVIYDVEVPDFIASLKAQRCVNNLILEASKRMEVGKVIGNEEEKEASPSARLVVRRPSFETSSHPIRRSSSLA